MTPSTAYSRDLGDELRSLRETCTGLSGNKLAVKLGWDPSKISTIEHGKARASEVDLIQFLSMCGKDIDFLNDFKRRYERAFDEYFVQMPGNLRTVGMAESTARRLTNYDTMIVPGMFQIPEYAEAVYHAHGTVSEERIPELVQCRTDRQALLRRHDRPDCVFFIHELALQQPMGDDEVMQAQYRRLHSKAHLIRLVPADIPVLSAGFILWEYEKANPVAYSESEFARVFVQDLGAIARARQHFKQLARVALDHEQTRHRLTQYLTEPIGVG
ncbi:helix-turn-helix domain-containing protein [Lentzea albidocapillata]|uniref:Helix-turn-helix domain-containing protein n=1 Tax=Lentzea albidocapillata TaxID=40571 RepID=A0A1W2F6X3_9PSEU|nr:helix-turn-helix transcriptional regulator [Lentzea albidocapillata]SMD17691.1 Helix-turn-helix domain-containing protein [Lentzea albidocapillata]